MSDLFKKEISNQKDQAQSKVAMKAVTPFVASGNKAALSKDKPHARQSVKAVKQGLEDLEYQINQKIGSNPMSKRQGSTKKESLANSGGFQRYSSTKSKNLAGNKGGIANLPAQGVAVRGKSLNIMTDQSLSRNERIMNTDLTPINNPGAVELNNSNPNVSFNKGTNSKAQSMGPKRLTSNIEEYFEAKYIESGKYLSPTSVNPKYNTANISQSQENSTQQGFINKTLSPNQYKDYKVSLKEDSINIFQKLSEYKKDLKCGNTSATQNTSGQVPNFFTKNNTSVTKQNSSLYYEKNIAANNSNENTVNNFHQNQAANTNENTVAQQTPSNPNLQRKSATGRKSADGSKSFDLNRNKKYLNEIFSKRGAGDHDNSYSELYEKRKIFEIINENDMNDSSRGLSFSRERGNRKLLTKAGPQNPNDLMRNLVDGEASTGNTGPQSQTEYDKLLHSRVNRENHRELILSGQVAPIYNDTVMGKDN
jgi:hypothetical protein